MILEIFLKVQKEFKITEVPTNGKLTLSVTTGETIVDKEKSNECYSRFKVEITKDQIITLGQVGAGKVEFVPNKILIMMEV